VVSPWDGYLPALPVLSGDVIIDPVRDPGVFIL
jgi:hypothetical protein